MPIAVLEHAAHDWTERSEIIKALRSGTVPRDGLERLAVLDADIDGELSRMLDDATSASGSARFVRGDYGSGKTFCCQLLASRARSAGFATSVVTLDRTSTTLAKPLNVYRAMLESMRVPGQAGEGVRALVDQWLTHLESVEVAGEAQLSLDARVARSLDHDGVRAANAELATALGAVRAALARGAFGDAFGLIAWMSGSDNVAHPVPREAGLSGRLRHDDVESAVRAIAALVRAAGLRGWLVVFDEVVTTLSLERRSREEAWGQVARIFDLWSQLPHTLWIFATTSDVMEHPRGLSSNPGLAQRVALVDFEGVRSLRQPQLVLEPMTEERLCRVAHRVVDLYVSDDVTRIRDACTDEVIASIVERVAAGFSGRVQMIPRAFLRSFVNLLDAFDAGRVPSLALARPTVDAADVAEANAAATLAGAPVEVEF